jgi:hypothetical protein
MREDGFNRELRKAGNVDGEGKGLPDKDPSEGLAIRQLREWACGLGNVQASEEDRL